MADFKRRHKRMVEEQIAQRGVRDPLVLQAMRAVPRDRFVAVRMAKFAFDDSPLPIEQGQTISQPYIVAMMIEAAEVHPGDRVLEIGAGSGYAAAVLGQIAAHVYAIERHETLAASARQRIVSLGYDNVEIIFGDGARGLPEHAPFDAIVVSAAAKAVPPALMDQLAVGGRLIIPVGDTRHQTLHKIVRRTETSYDEAELLPVLFVPLVTEMDTNETASAPGEVKGP